jgi:hypothetical protein
MKFSRTLVFVAVFALVGVFSPWTEGRVWWSGSHRAGSYEVEVLVGGYARPVYYRGGHAYIEGRRGERYVIRVRNRSWRRVEALISVDGRDVIDGKPSNLNKRGYVIPAYSYVDVDGFRINYGEVAAFRFTSVPDSYASRMGTPWEVGIIGVAVFPERSYRPRPRPRPPYVLRGERKSAPGDWDESQDRVSAGATESAPRSSRNIGTQFGERRASPVSETRFVRQNWGSPAARLSLRYDDRDGLCSLGIGSFCYYPHYPPYEPPYQPYQPPQDFSEPPPGWEHFNQWY